ncbi:coronin-7 isoform X1 [Tachysurus ichikawai]
MLVKPQCPLLEWISNVRGSSLNSQGNHIKSSCSIVAFNTDQTGGGMVGLSSLDPGPDGKFIVTQIPCHTDQVTDLDFSPFDDYLLATCSADETVKVWRLCDPGQEQPLSANASFSPGEGRLELVLFHPTAAGLLAVGSGRGVQVWDTNREKALAVLEQHKEQLQGLAWKDDGSLLASTCKVSQCLWKDQVRRVGN